MGKENQDIKEKKDIAIVYMVAGISSRFGGEIKQFAEIGVNGESLIEYSLNQALPAGFNKIYFIVGNGTAAPFMGKFGDSYKGVPVGYAMQTHQPKERDRPWGTADAVASLRKKIDCPFVVCNGDNIYGENTFRELYEHLKKSNQEDATLGYRLGDVLPNEGARNIAIFSVRESYVQGLKEVSGLERARLPEGITLDDLCSKNIYAMHPRTVEMLYDKVEEFKREHVGDRKIEAFLPDMISGLVGEGLVKMRIYPAVEGVLHLTRLGDLEGIRDKINGKLK